MIFVSSDWHGCSVETVRQLLSIAGFSQRDYLYVLGDVIDRGADGAALLLYLMEQPNMQLILGNHESMLLACDWLFDEITDSGLDSLSDKKMHSLSVWMYNGAQPTLTGLKKLSKSKGVIGDILDYLRDAPLYEALSVNGRDFLLTHAGLGNFAPDKKLSAYSAEELLWNRPSLSDVYHDDITTVFGHTPSGFFGPGYEGRIIQTRTWIDVDTGSGHGGSPCLLRLDDLSPFYIDC